MNKFWKFKNQVSHDGPSNLYLEGDIASETWWGDEVTPEAFRSELRQMKGDLTVHINSQGGDVFAGVAIYNALKDYSQGKGRVIVKVDGLAASIASVVAMAGDEIIMSPGSMMMVHNPWSMGVGSSDELRKAADTLDEIKDAIKPIYTERSGLSDEEVQDLMDNETWMTAEKAVELGFADTVQKASKKEPEPKDEDEGEPVNLMMANFAFSMSATRSAMKDLIKKVNNSERTTQMNDEELKKTETEAEAADTATKAEVQEAQDKVETEVKDECDGTCKKATEDEAKTEDEAEDTNAEEGEKADEEAETKEGEETDEGDIADKVEAKIKALQDENAKLKEENEALKNAVSSAEAKASAKDDLQVRLTKVLNMAEQADGGDVSGEKEDKKPVDTYGNALADAFKELS